MPIEPIEPLMFPNAHVEGWIIFFIIIGIGIWILIKIIRLKM